MKKQITNEACFRDYDVYAVRRAWLNRNGNQTIKSNPLFIGKKANGQEYGVILTKYSDEYIRSMTVADLSRIAVY